MNNTIVVAALVITSAGVVNATTNKTSISRVVMGGYVFLLVLSLIDVFGGPVAKIASALSMVAMLYVLLNVFPWQVVLKTLQGKKG